MPRVCERMCSEEPINIAHVWRYLPLTLFRFFAKRNEFYTKVLTILTLLIKATLNSGKNG